jgi:DtxR family transcriptional regulator, Mn-dependent transcriptional regulator
MDEELQHEIDEHLEAIWTVEESGRDGDVETILSRTAGGGRREVLEIMEQRKLLRLHNGHLDLSDEGRRQAEGLIRRHRLAERLLADVLGVVGQGMDQAACEFEHFLSEEVTESICTLLGHPPTCPHGHPIPRGTCCSRGSTEVKQLVARLDACAVGERGRISLISSRVPNRLKRLGTLGLLPGATVRLRQKSPAYVIEVGETTIALEEELAREIFLKRT